MSEPHYRWKKRHRQQNLYNQNYRRAHPEKVRQWERKRTQTLRKQAMEKIGGLKCIRCGCEEYRLLEINHKRLGGHKDFAKRGARNVYRLIVRGDEDPNDYEVTCKVCNAAHYSEAISAIRYKIVSIAPAGFEPASPAYEAGSLPD